MMKGFRAEVRGNQLHVHGVDDGLVDLVDWAEFKGDYLVVVRKKGHNAWYAVGERAYYPASITLSRLVPISSKDQRMNGRSLKEFPREKRVGFYGHYRIEENYFEFTPGRNRGMVRDLCRLMDEFAKGKNVDWNNIKLLDGKEVKREGASRIY